MKTEAEIAREAADYLETVGWFQGSYFPNWPNARDGAISLGQVVKEAKLPVCVAGALYGFSMLDDNTGAFVTRDVQEFLVQRTGPDADIVQWNDAPGRTKEDVVSLLRDFADAQ